ncbi:MAG: DNA-processing protein DprA [Sphaerochaetaceae bacterium]|jgi:DNA processing protein|nr:DNA-processing protein DprA [Candidatus Methanomethylophilaceae archaeon]
MSPILDQMLLLTLLQTQNMGRKTVQELITALQKIACKDNPIDNLIDLKNALEALSVPIKRINPRFRQPTLEQLEWGYKRSKDIVERCSELGIIILCSQSNNFPPSLRSIPDPPLILYVKGNNKPLAHDRSIAIVGTRKPTSYGVEAAHSLGAACAAKGIVVVSGLAEGCDTAAHEGCLDAGGLTVAVLAHGLDIVYPKRNTHLAQRILEEGGCLISEYPPGNRYFKNYFVERNRIQSGLSCGIVVIETDVKGGTIHTVNHALNQKRPVGCLQHPEADLHHAKVQGNQNLICSNKAYSIQIEIPGSFENFLAHCFRNDSLQTGCPLQEANDSAVAQDSFSAPLKGLHSTDRKDKRLFDISRSTESDQINEFDNERPSGQTKLFGTDSQWAQRANQPGQNE